MHRFDGINSPLDHLGGTNTNDTYLRNNRVSIMAQNIQPDLALTGELGGNRESTSRILDIMTGVSNQNRLDEGDRPHPILGTSFQPCSSDKGICGSNHVTPVSRAPRNDFWKRSLDLVSHSFSVTLLNLPLHRRRRSNRFIAHSGSLAAAPSTL
jgi:hypothetical protein